MHLCYIVKNIGETRLYLYGSMVGISVLKR